MQGTRLRLVRKDLDGADGLGESLVDDFLFRFEMDAILVDFLGRDQIEGFAAEELSLGRRC
jgi:hypothetical protein